MKSKKSGKRSSRITHAGAALLLARAVQAEKLAEAARKHARMTKSQYKAARKAFKHARRAAKQALKEAAVAAARLKADGEKTHKRTNRK